ncbi:hypothetical protein APR50_06135 [Variovorax paradoxus]|jgi:5-methylthioadenosine/S-adenosylhomocysteine deaminase|uniref:amidohydrolase family protein n=1 Tax=Variovorax paradoxus TaxID=34073 RepID=UPI0006E4B0AC|nr:hypothetical protein APR52_08795 [Variovorax paradoxus]KPV10643.1 hypothetical protein APR50_06135 [Variovorax paradoxus]KPV13036.1 hypothetical protein APR49_05495 [Variovorax paradoxus]KPV25126.1 hypothetical protein APR51_02325 [Variovorax paradoxus]KPV36264.1 hypothetical protein APR48_01580 [Variovorax paradoxus]
MRPTPRQADLIVEAAHIATVDAALGRIRDGAVAVRDGRIADLGPRARIHADWQAPRVDRHPRALMVPGLVDVHVHPGLFFFARLGRAPTPEQPGLLARGGQIERFLTLLGSGLRLDPDQTRAAARASLLRGLEAGVTYFNDAAAGDTEALVAAALDVGVRGVVSYDFGADLGFDLGEDPPALIRTADTDRVLARAEATVARHHGRHGMQCWYNLICDLNASDALYLETMRLATRDGVGINTHTATVRHHETVSRRCFGKGSVRRLLDLGVVGPNWIGAHMGFMAPEDMAALATAGAHIAHCPGTSMGSGKGIVAGGAIPALMRAGVNVALGTDSAQWPDLSRQMSMAYYAHKEAMADDALFDPDTVLEMATLAGARACGEAARRGSLSVGKCADLVLVDTDQLGFAPFDDPLLAWLRTGGGSVRDVYVEGRHRVKDGRAADIDREAVARLAEKAAREFVATVRASSPATLGASGSGPAQ